jgi:tRNA (guanine-N7-)-methyltransferase
LAKKKHHKRRLFQANFIKMILKKIISKGRLFFATDNEDYYEKSLLILEEDVSKTTTILIQKKDNKRLVLTKYFKRAQKLGNNVNFLVIVKL